MMQRKKTWCEKRDEAKNLPRVETISDAMSSKWGIGTVVIPAPREVDELMRQVPRGKLITVNDIRRALAARHGATIGCPLTTGIFVWIAAHAAMEEAAIGREDSTPYWRTLKSGGELNPKYPGGIEDQKQRLEIEGHRVIQKGKRFTVADYERSLIDLSVVPRGR